jgi:hypothetical protein
MAKSASLCYYMSVLMEHVKNSYCQKFINFFSLKMSRMILSVLYG